MNRRFAVAALVAACAAPAARAARGVTSADVDRAIARGLTYLAGQQRDDGSWPLDGKYASGAAALATLTLVTAGVPANDPAVQAGAMYIAAQPLTMTYSTALTAMALAAMDAKAYRNEIKACRDWLILAQQKNGGWTYKRDPRHAPDNSNSQFAVLGLRAAQEAGLPAPTSVWKKVRKYFRAGQRSDGGWGYSLSSAHSYGSMTAAGIASLIICDMEEPRRIRWCGQYAYDMDVEKGLRWFGRRFTVRQNPGQGSRNLLYYLYAVERVGVLSARRRLAGRDWYREGAAALVAMQRREGCWGSGVMSLPETCFALLFLAKGKAPVLVHKLERLHDWNNDPNDIRRLCAYFTQTTGQKVSWQIIDLGADLRDLLAAPVLYFNGHNAFAFKPEEVKKLREFIAQGGFIFAEACCGKRAFDQAFRAFAKQLFPERPLARLPDDHPVYSAFFRLKRNERRPLWGLRASCRTSIIYSPTDLSCAWEKNSFDDPAFKLGLNVLAYATGLEPLRGKLERVKLIQPAGEGPALRGAFVLGQVKHGGDWEPDTRSAAGLLQFMRTRLNLDVASDKVPVTLTSPHLFDFPVLYMVSHHPLQLSDKEKSRLKLYLERGGFLFAESCCGNPVFDRSFRALMAELFPDHPLKRLPPTHPIFSTGFPLRSVTYRKAVRKEHPHLTEPWLEGVEIKGRLAVAYSKFGLGCGWENHPCLGCRGLVRDDALKLGADVVLYGLTN